ncbi:MAG: LD-carboxypeptidase, partial [Phycicoccus sp.]
MTVRWPEPLRRGELVGVTSPSSGVDAALWPRLEVALDAVRAAGFAVQVGECISGDGVTSAPAADRAAELERML